MMEATWIKRCNNCTTNKKSDSPSQKQITKHKIENTDMKTSEITQNHEQIPKMETHDSDSKQDLEDSGKHVSIVQNITYNIQDSSIVGDLNTEINSDLE